MALTFIDYIDYNLNNLLFFSSKALINLLKFLMSNETVLLAKHNIFTLALMVSINKNVCFSEADIVR